MVRKLMLIFGLSLTAAAFGCSDDESGSGGSAGTGGTGGTTGACINAADTAIICESTFMDEVAACGFGEGAEAISTCVTENTGVSGACATCFGDVTECGALNCSTDCGPAPDSQECTVCRAANCGAAFNACAGEYDCGGGAGGSGGSGGSGGA
jgi:hypothetical protein